MAEQRLRVATLKSPEWVTYHFPSIREMSPSRTDNLCLSVRALSVLIAARGRLPHIFVASLEFDRNEPCAPLIFVLAVFVWHPLSSIG